VIAALADVRRADGRLENGVVTWDGLDADVRSRITGEDDVTWQVFCSPISHVPHNNAVPEAWYFLHPLGLWDRRVWGIDHSRSTRNARDFGHFPSEFRVTDEFQQWRGWWCCGGREIDAAAR
jgi:hypothetical protein